MMALLVWAVADSATVGLRETRDRSTRPCAASSWALLCRKLGCWRIAISIARSRVRTSGPALVVGAAGSGPPGAAGVAGAAGAGAGAGAG